MKKIIAALICMSLFVAVGMTASAEAYAGKLDQKVYFDINASCNSTTTYNRVPDCEEKINSVAAIFVYHDDNVMTEEYTNSFSWTKSQECNGCGMDNSRVEVVYARIEGSDSE